MDGLNLDWVPQAEGATVVMAFGGWNDAGEAATSAIEHLQEALDARPFGRLEAEGYYDFQQARPQIAVLDGVIGEISWPGVDFSFAPTPKGGVVLVHGLEPQLGWPSFCQRLVELADTVGARRAVALGALLTDVPHTRPSRLQGTATDPEVLHRLGIEGAEYEGPTGVVGVAMRTFAEAGFEATSLWASVPHYVSVSPNPKAMLGLVRVIAPELGAEFDSVALEAEATEYQEQIDAAMADNPEVQAYVKLLESRADMAAFGTGAEGGDTSDGDPLVSGERIPTGDELAAELQRYLESQGGDDT